MSDDFDSNSTPERPSKSARKREDQQLQQLAAALLELPAAELARIPLEPALGAALEATRAITQREARRRQLQYLGKLMRNADHPAIRTALDGLRMRQRQFRQHLERIDRLCEELITGATPPSPRSWMNPGRPPHSTASSCASWCARPARRMPPRAHAANCSIISASTCSDGDIAAVAFNCPAGSAAWVR